MFERFTNNARQVVVLAQEEARGLGHVHIGTEHVLLGLLGGSETGLARQVLGDLHVQLERTRQLVAQAVPPQGSPSGHIPFTPRAKKVLELSLREALALGHNYIGTEHILLGVVREGEGLGAEVLVQQGVGLDVVRAAVVGRIEKLEREGGGQVLAPLRTPAGEAATSAARELAGGAPVGTQHLLEALARTDEGLAAKVLTSLGLDADTIAARIDELGPEGTGDASPEQSGLRGMEVRLEGDEVHVVLRDAATVELARRATEQLGGPVRGDDPVASSLVGIWHASRRGLEDLLRRVNPPVEEDEGKGSSLPSVVQRAVQSRLRRRKPPAEG
jgi:ATP-dependent Clp protease ATP-binding subunit ClpC